MGLLGFGSTGSGDVVARGRSDRADVVGVLVGGGSGRHRTVDYALDVHGPHPFRGGVRLGSDPPMVVRLGTSLQVLHLNSRVVIDWLGSGAEGVVDTQSLKVAPAPGIEDRTLGLGPIQLRGVPARATIEAAEVSTSGSGGDPAMHLALCVERHGLSGYETELVVAQVPHYADHLCAVGRSLPVWVLPERPDAVVIDWPAAATAEPGVDEPPAAVVTELPGPAGPRTRGNQRGRARHGRHLVAPSADDDDVVIDLTGDDGG